MTKEELHALVDARFDELEALKTQPSFLAYEQQFAHIWNQLGGQVLQETIGKAPANPRKKTPVKAGLEL